MRILSITFMAALVLSACSSLKVTSDYDKAADFTKYQDFYYLGWAEDSDKMLNDIEKDRIENAFGKEFEKRGIKFVGQSEADAAVMLFIVVDQKTSTTAYTNHYGGYGYGGGMGGYPGWGWGGGQSTTTYSEHDYLVGTLVVDVFDVESKSLVWQGVGSKTVSENPQKRESNIVKVAAAIMANYPVPIKE
ncbi:MAG: DUF4136 domain-containing protein [Maribacter sp.]|nr:DUF4136 domain-containing protein [Maribacter sp.]